MKTDNKITPEIMDRLEWYDGGDGMDYEIWIDTKLQTLYRVPIELKRYWDEAQVLDETIKYY